MNGAVESQSRRDFFLSAGVVSLIVLGATGCSQRRAPISCDLSAGLAPEEVQARSALRYVEPGSDETRRCSSCQQYLTPPEDGGCGSCKVLKGPIHPNGTCMVFAPRSA